MTEAWIEVGSSLVGVALAAGFMFATSPGRRYAARTRRRLGSSGPLRFAIAMAGGTLVGVTLVQWLLGGGPPRPYEVASGLILAAGAGAICYAIGRTAPGDE